MGAAPCRLDGVERKVPGGIEQIQPGRFQLGQVDRRFTHVDTLQPTGRGICNDLRPHLIGLTDNNRIGMKEPLLRHDRGVHATQDHGDVSLPVMICDLVGTVGPEDLEGDPHKIRIVVQADLCNPLVLDGDRVSFRRGRRHRRQGKGHDLRPLRPGSDRRRYELDLHDRTSPNGFIASRNAMFREDDLPKLNMPGAKGPGIGEKVVFPHPFENPVIPAGEPGPCFLKAVIPGKQGFFIVGSEIVDVLNHQETLRGPANLGHARQ